MSVRLSFTIKALKVWIGGSHYCIRCQYQMLHRNDILFYQACTAEIDVICLTLLKYVKQKTLLEVINAKIYKWKMTRAIHA